MLPLGPDPKYISRLTPDGSEILYNQFYNPSDNSATRLMRIPMRGGPPSVIVQIPRINNHQCSRAPASVCVVSQQLTPHMALSVFDPVQGNLRPLLTLDLPSSQVYNWSLSPDGKYIAAAATDIHQNVIHLFPLSGGPSRDIPLKGWTLLTSLDWAADSKGLFVSANPTGRQSTLMFVDLSGQIHPLWTLKVLDAFSMWAIPSRDGRHLAVLAPTVESNISTLQNF